MESVSPFADWSRNTGRTRLCCVLQVVRQRGSLLDTRRSPGEGHFAVGSRRVERSGSRNGFDPFRLRLIGLRRVWRRGCRRSGRAGAEEFALRVGEELGRRSLLRPCTARWVPRSGHDRRRRGSLRLRFLGDTALLGGREEVWLRLILELSCGGFRRVTFANSALLVEEGVDHAMLAVLDRLLAAYGRHKPRHIASEVTQCPAAGDDRQARDRDEAPDGRLGQRPLPYGARDFA